MNNIFDDLDWDSPFYKKLPKNDSGEAAGNQAGFLIPKTLTGYFPCLDGITNQKTPTLSEEINIELYKGSVFIKKVITRYQAQTWGGTRSPEYRITGNVNAIKDPSKVGDYLLMQRSISDITSYRFILIAQGTKEYKILDKQANGKKAGFFHEERPVSYSDIEKAESEERVIEGNKFNLIDPHAGRVETRGSRVARSIVFKNRVMEAYSYACAITGDSLRTPSGQHELEAAHIIPRSRNGADDVRNGLALTRRLHWAFDRGLFSFDETRAIIVPRKVKKIPENGFLASLEGKKINEPLDAAKRSHPDALSWHRENILIK